MEKLMNSKFITRISDTIWEERKNIKELNCYKSFKVEPKIQILLFKLFTKIAIQILLILRFK